MNRRIIKFSVFIILLIVASILLYIHFSPKSVLSEDPTFDYTQMTYSEFLSDSNHLSGKKLLLVKNEDEDNEFVLRNILGSLISENPTSNISVEIITIDTSQEKDLTVTQLKDNFNVENTPAFVYGKIQDNKLDIKATLPYYEDEPFTKDDFKDWLYDQGIWEGQYLIDDDE